MANDALEKTLLRALIDASGLSRRKAFAAIREGRVQTGGVAVSDPSAAYTGGTLTLDGRRLGSTRSERVYLMLNKPAGVLSTVTDTHGRATVLDFVPAGYRLPGLHPVGRLDRDSTGLLLLTNDGSLTFRLTHPRHEVEKEYWLRARPQLTPAQLERLRAGVEIDGAQRRPVDVHPLPLSSGYQVSVTIREGRKRQVRRMVEAAGSRVTALTRVREGPLALGGLEPGEVRLLTQDELTSLGIEAPPETRASRRRRANRDLESRSGRSGPRR
jgi:23S rRNA pseudouridine2605 synthase